MWTIVVVDLATALKIEHALDIALVAVPWFGFIVMLLACIVVSRTSVFRQYETRLTRLPLCSTYRHRSLTSVLHHASGEAGRSFTWDF